MALPNDHVSHTTAVKRNRVGNVGTDRLVRRYIHLLAIVHLRSGRIPTRHMWAMRAAELTAIRGELATRNVPQDLLDLLADRVDIDSVNL